MLGGGGGGGGHVALVQSVWGDTVHGGTGSTPTLVPIPFVLFKKYLHNTP